MIEPTTSRVMLQMSLAPFLHLFLGLWLSAHWQAGAALPPPGPAGALGFAAGEESRIAFEKPGHRAFRLDLSRSEFLELVVTPHHLQARVRIVGDDGAGGETGCASFNGVAHCAVIGGRALSRQLQIEVTSVEPGSSPFCGVKVLARRSAAADDQSRVLALRQAAAGDVERQKGKSGFPEAARLWELSLALFEDAGDRAGQARVSAALGSLYFRQGDNARALEALRRTLRLSRAESDAYSEADALYTLARMRADAGDNEGAIDLYRRCLDLRRTVGDGFGAALAVHNLASAHWAIGDTEEALRRYREALEIRERIQDRTGVSYTLYGIAVAQWTQGLDQEALDTYQRALSLWRELGNRAGEANTLNSIGLIYSGLKEPGRALRYFDQALAIWKSLGAIAGEAYTHNNMGMVYADQGEAQRARDAYRDALGLLEPLNDLRGKAYVHHNLGGLLIQSGDLEKALEHLRLSRQMKEKLGDRFGMARTLDRLGEVRLRRGEGEEALSTYRKALDLQEEIGDRHGKVLSLGGLARTELALGRPQDSLERIRSAIGLIESLRLSFRSDDLKTAFFAGWRDYYGFEIETMMKLHRLRPDAGYDRQALDVSEQARSRSLLEALSKSGAGVESPGQPSPATREASLRGQIERKAESLDRLENGGFSKRQMERLEEELDQLLAEYQDVRSGILGSDPHYSSLLSPRPFDSTLQRTVLGDDSLFLEFFLGKQSSFLWAVTSESVDVFELPPEGELNARALRLHQDLTARNRADQSESRAAARRRVEQADSRSEMEAMELGKVLLGSLPARLRRKRLLVAADGFLHYVPFSALPVPASWKSPPSRPSREAGDYLGLVHELVSVPSLAVLEELRRVPRRRAGPRRLALFADPVFTADDPRVTPRGASGDARSVSSAPRGADYRRLRFSRLEAEEIAGLVPSSNRFLALGFSASRRTLEATPLGEYEFLHFATHTILDNQHPELSGIVLSLVDEQGRRQDGLVRLYEIYNLKLGADLVVLSSCRTALGKRVGGEGLVGLARGFLYAGASSVLASLWQVEDRASSVFMRKFYSEMLGAGKSRPEALRSAQRAMFEDGRWRTPYYWAPFVLQGDWR